MAVSYYIQVIEGNNIGQRILTYTGRRRQRYMSEIERWHIYA